MRRLAVEVGQPLRPALRDARGHLLPDLAHRVPGAVRRDLRGLRLLLPLPDRPSDRRRVQGRAGGGSVPSLPASVLALSQRLLADHLRAPSGVSGEDAQGLSPSPDEPFWPGIRLDLNGANLIDLFLDEASIAKARFYRATFTGVTWIHRATFTGRAMFLDATFSTVSISGAHVLNLDHPGFGQGPLAPHCVWPVGWTVRPDADDPTRGTLVHEEHAESPGPATPPSESTAA